MAIPKVAQAHDIRIPVEEIKKAAGRIHNTLEYLRRKPAIPPLPQTPYDQRLILGASEIELAIGNRNRALQMLMGRLADPNFRALPEYVDTLLLTSEILEFADETVGAMHYAELALKKGGTPEQMAEAGARWFRVARLNQVVERRLEMYALWRAQGGERAAGSEVAAEVKYEAAFALRADRRFASARALLAKVPSESAYGSRAAFLAGVIFVEEGDLANAERWFSAIMGWPLPALPPKHPQLKIEIAVRELAALSSGRLRYEKGDLEASDQAYRMIAHGSDHEAEACWERAYLDMERKRRRGALKRLQCVVDIGARGARYVDAALFRASLMAHLRRYSDSVTSYKLLHKNLERQRDLFAAAVDKIEEPAAFLFDGMDRNAVDEGAKASPGPALLSDTWNADVDRAYRIDRGSQDISDQTDGLVRQVVELSEGLARDDAFAGVRLRRDSLLRTLQEINHLLGHAGELEFATHRRHASTRLAMGETHEHNEEAATLATVIKQLRQQAKVVENDLVQLDRMEAERRTKALRMLLDIKREADTIRKDLAALEAEAKGPINGVARSAIHEVRAALQDAAMRAEFGVLDTFWLKKEHRTKEIEALLDMRRETERQVFDVLEELQREDREEEPFQEPALIE